MAGEDDVPIRLAGRCHDGVPDRGSPPIPWATTAVSEPANLNLADDLTLEQGAHSVRCGVHGGVCSSPALIFRSVTCRYVRRRRVRPPPAR